MHNKISSSDVGLSTHLELEIFSSLIYTDIAPRFLITDAYLLIFYKSYPQNILSDTPHIPNTAALGTSRAKLRRMQTALFRFFL